MDYPKLARTLLGMVGLQPEERMLVRTKRQYVDWNGLKLYFLVTGSYDYYVELLDIYYIGNRHDVDKFIDEFYDFYQLNTPENEEYLLTEGASFETDFPNEERVNYFVCCSNAVTRVDNLHLAKISLVIFDKTFLI